MNEQTEISAEKEKLQKEPDQHSGTKKYSVWKNSLDEINGRLEITKKRVHKLGSRSVEIIQAEE